MNSSLFLTSMELNQKPVTVRKFSRHVGTKQHNAKQPVSKKKNNEKKNQKIFGIKKVENTKYKILQSTAIATL